MADSIIIIGGGITGLAAGCYARMNGYTARIFEMHDKPGGVCTAWDRKGYTFDGCIHWLVGTKDGSSFNQAWRELGALPGPRIVDHDEFVHIEDASGRKLVLYTDPDRLERHMKELSPADGPWIDELIDAVRKFQRMETPLDLPGSREEAVKLLRNLPDLVRALLVLRGMGRLTALEYADRFADPLLREAFGRLLSLPDMPAYALPMTMAWLSARDAGYPEGGSLEFSRSIERRYLDLGGEVSYKSAVRRILVEDDRAVGVLLEDGTEHRADVVISAADGHATIFGMLEGRYLSAQVLRAYSEWPLWDPLVQVSIGVSMDLSESPHSVSIPLEKPIDVGGRSEERLSYHHFCYDATLAPEGCSSVVVFFGSDFDYWSNLRADRKRYNAEKDRIASEVIDALEKRFSGFRDGVEAVDVATPVTTERYTGNWRGSYEGWRLTRETGGYIIRKMSKTLPGLEGFYMAGQWLQPGGGLPTAAQMGRDVIKDICKKDRRRFVTTEGVAPVR